MRLFVGYRTALGIKCCGTKHDAVVRPVLCKRVHCAGYCALTWRLCLGFLDRRFAARKIQVFSCGCHGIEALQAGIQVAIELLSQRHTAGAGGELGKTLTYGITQFSPCWGTDNVRQLFIWRRDRKAKT